MGDDGKRITDTDLMAVADAVMAIECKPIIKMRQFTAVSGSNMLPTASVTLVVNGVEMTGAATCDGPVDAAMEVLRKCVADVADIRVEEYHVDAIRGGTDALVDVTVRLSKDGKIITSRGARTDIIMASVEAMIAGMKQTTEGQDMKTGAKILVESLQREGTEIIFGNRAEWCCRSMMNSMTRHCGTSLYGTNRLQRMPRMAMRGQAVV